MAPSPKFPRTSASVPPRLLSRAIAAALAVSLVAPSVSVAAEGLVLAADAVLDQDNPHVKLPDLGDAAATPRNDAFDRMLGWLAHNGQAGTEGMADRVVDQGLAAGVDSLRGSGLPFLGSLQGAIHYDTVRTRFDFDLLTVQRLAGDGDGHHWLAQLGAHNRLDRPTANVGLIYRWVDLDRAWLLGGNVFYDRDFDSGAKRVGTGVEAVSPTTRLFANLYRALGGRWYATPDNALREERAADGYDLGITYTPAAIPALDLQLQGTRWNGEEVDVFGTGKFERDPTVWAAKVGYTPIPLVTLSAEREHIPGGDGNTRVGVSLNYRLGVPLAEQTHTMNAAQRTDLGFRALSPVERENRIVTESRLRAVAQSAATPPVANSVAIDGTPAIGATLTGAFLFADADGDAEGLHLFQWYRATDAAGSDRTPIAGATTRSYAVTADDEGHYLVFEVTPVSVRGEAGVATRATTASVVTKDANAPVASAVAIDGDNVVGATLSGTFTYTDADGDAEGTHGFQWYRASDAAGASRTPIPGATASSYTITAADAGQYLVFEVTPVSAAGETGSAAAATTSAPVAQVLTNAPEATNVAIDGTVTAGSTLVGKFTFFDADGDLAGNHAYQWYRATDAAGDSRVAIAGATDSSYTITAADQGRYLVFEVTPKAVSGAPATGVAVRAVTGVSVTGAAPPVINDLVVVASANQVGRNFSGFFTYSDEDGDLDGFHQYQWYRATDAAGNNRTPINGATNDIYTAVGADQDYYLVLEVTPVSQSIHAPIGTPVRAVSSGLITGTAPVASDPKITGTAEVGATLNGSFTYTDADNDAPGPHTYQWYRATDAAGENRTPIATATGSQYTVTADDYGQYLVFEATPVSASGNPRSGQAVRTVMAAPVVITFRNDTDSTATDPYLAASSVTVSGVPNNGQTNATVSFRVIGQPNASAVVRVTNPSRTIRTIFLGKADEDGIVASSYSVNFSELNGDVNGEWTLDTSVQGATFTLDSWSINF